jgi:hypothetical protein
MHPTFRSGEVFWLYVKIYQVFLEIGLHDVGLVGGKTASLGELYSTLASESANLERDTDRMHFSGSQ